MFNINLSPVRLDVELSASVSGKVVTLNGEAFDFGFMQDGDMLPADAIDTDFITNSVKCADGAIHLTLNLPHGANAPHETRFPEPITVTTSGPVNLPPFDVEGTEPEEDTAE